MGVLLAFVAVALLLFAGPARANTQTSQSNTPLLKGTVSKYELREFKAGAAADRTCDQDVRTYAGYVWTSGAVGSPEAKRAESACGRGHVVGTGYPENCWFYDYDALRNLTTAHWNYLSARGYPFLSERFMQYARKEYQDGEADLVRAAGCIAGIPGAEQKLAAGLATTTKPEPKPSFRPPGFQPFTPFVPSPSERQVARQMTAGRPGWVTGAACPAPEGWYCHTSPGQPSEWCKVDLHGSGWYCRRAPASSAKPSGTPSNGNTPSPNPTQPTSTSPNPQPFPPPGSSGNPLQGYVNKGSNPANGSSSGGSVSRGSVHGKILSSGSNSNGAKAKAKLGSWPSSTPRTPTSTASNSLPGNTPVQKDVFGNILSSGSSTPTDAGPGNTAPQGTLTASNRLPARPVVERKVSGKILSTGRKPSGTPTSGSQPTGENPQKQPDGYTAQGADPALRYAAGFSKGVKDCVKSQVTAQNLALAVLSQKYKQVGALLAIVSAPSAFQAALNPPQISQISDPYLRGEEQGRLLCEWVAKVAPAYTRQVPGKTATATNEEVPTNGASEPAANGEQPGYGTEPTGPNENAPTPLRGEAQANGATPKTGPTRGGHTFGPPVLPPTTFKNAMATMQNWLPKVNGGKGSSNCVLTAAATAWYLLGKPLYPAPKTCGPLNLKEARAVIGRTFTEEMSDVAMYKYVDALPNGSVGMVTSMAKGGKIGHAFTFVKANGEVYFPDGQPGGQVMNKASYETAGYRVSVMGNGLQPR